ncbi:hypothetical protein CRG98_047438 [Punica granatum]|uniref:Uncharacterized protein n=1 Tax=Punica granatum TaxID=22663 RepID=A0A2I0HKI2_PUNGR|nr:hypothetical protein CRG98_047438 [Punica granatum]
MTRSQERARQSWGRRRRRDVEVAGLSWGRGLAVEVRSSSSEVEVRSSSSEVGERARWSRAQEGCGRRVEVTRVRLSSSKCCHTEGKKVEAKRIQGS